MKGLPSDLAGRSRLYTKKKHIFKLFPKAPLLFSDASPVVSSSYLLELSVFVIRIK